MPGRTRLIAAIWRVLIASLAAPFLAGTASAQAVDGWTDKQKEKRLERFAELTPAGFADSITIEDDDLEPVATLSTTKGFEFKGGFTDRVRADNLLRAFIDKRTGLTKYQVYFHLSYTGDNRNFRIANFETGDGPGTAQLLPLGHRLDCISSYCAIVEDFGFDVSADLLKSIGDRAMEQPVRPWRIRLKAQAGPDWTDDMAPAEAAGLLLAVARYKQVHKLP